MSNIITIAQTVWLELIRRKDIYIILVLQVFFTFLLTMVDAFGSEVPSSYIMDIGLMLAFALSIIMSITMGIRLFPQEIRSGSIYTVLTKPIGRLEFLLGKWLGLWTGMAATTALFYGIVTLITLTKGYVFSPLTLVQTFGLHSMLLAIVIALSLFFTQFLTQAGGGTASAIAVILCYFFLPRIPNLLVYESGWRESALWIIYFISPHLELFDMRARVLHNWGTLDAGIFMGTIAYGLVLTAAILALAWLIFRRKHFSRGTAL